MTGRARKRLGKTLCHARNGIGNPSWKYVNFKSRMAKRLRDAGWSTAQERLARATLGAEFESIYQHQRQGFVFLHSVPEFLNERKNSAAGLGAVLPRPLPLLGLLNDNDRGAAALALGSDCGDALCLTLVMTYGFCSSASSDNTWPRKLPHMVSSTAEVSHLSLAKSARSAARSPSWGAAPRCPPGRSLSASQVLRSTRVVRGGRCSHLRSGPGGRRVHSPSASTRPACREYLPLRGLLRAW